MNILITICARAGSKGLPNKHMLDMCGKPLIQWTIEQAQEAQAYFESAGHQCAAVLSTDSQEIIKRFGLIVGFVERPAILCLSETPKLEAIRHASSWFINNDCVIDLDATNPMRTVDDIRGAFDLCVESGRNVLSAVKARKNPYFNQVEKAGSFGVGTLGEPVLRIVDEYETVSPDSYLTRQSAPPVYDLNASISIFGKKTLLNESVKSATGNAFTIYLMPDYTAFDIDTELDFKIVEMIMREKIKEGLL